MALFVGYSTKTQNGRTKLVDQELVIQDLLNALNIRPGERVMNPKFGCSIWRILFDPLDDTSTELVTEEMTRIVNNDPRLQLESVRVQEYEHGLQFLLQINLVQLESTETLFVQFDRDSETVTGSVV